MGRVITIVMSNVFKRYHTPTGNEFYDKLVFISTELTRLVMNEKIVPKKYRYVYSIPIINKLNQLRDDIKAEMTLYPTSEKLVEYKKDIWQRAIIHNEQIIELVQTMLIELPSINIDKFENVGNALVEESAILRKCKSNTKLQK